MSAVQIVKYKTEISQFYLTLSEYLNKWMKTLEIFSAYSWMTLKKNPDRNEVEKSIEYLTTKNIKINDTHLFDQITAVGKIMETEIKANSDWKHLNSSEKWIVVFSKMSKDFPEQYIDIYTICEYVFSIPGHNANVERIFSMMEIQWTDERNRLLCLKQWKQFYNAT